jgi:hypothetical protein
MHSGYMIKCNESSGILNLKNNYKISPSKLRNNRYSLSLKFTNCSPFLFNINAMELWASRRMFLSVCKIEQFYNADGKSLVYKVIKNLQITFA